MKRIRNVMITVAVTSSLVAVPVAAAPDTDTIRQNKAAVEQQIDSASSQLQNLLVDFEVLKGDISSQEVKIAQADEDLKAAQAKEKKQYEEMLVRIKYMYEKGGESEVSALLGASSFSEVINQAEYIQSVHNYDRKMLNEYKKTKEEVETLKGDLEAGKADMELMADSYKEEEKNLQSTIAVMRTQVKDFDTQLAAAQKAAEAEAKRIAEETKAMESAGSAGENSAKPSGSTESGTQKPSGSTGTDKPSESKPSENKPSESKPSESKPSESKPSESKPSESKPSESKPSQDKEDDKQDDKQEEKPAEKPSNTSKGRKIANIGLKYVGNPYVYGGNSLTDGIDCSGFTKKIHELCGIYGLSRTSGGQRTGGKAVNGLSNALPGDVICYSGHVAIYIGNGQIVHASNPSPYPAGGIKTGSATYRSILAIRRYW